MKLLDDYIANKNNVEIYRLLKNLKNEKAIFFSLY